MHKTFITLLLALGTASALAGPQELIDSYAAQARQENAAFAGFSAARGETFYHAKGGGKSDSCAACHTASPKNLGRHERTGKEIQPLAPAANPRRLTDAAEVEKWFRRNCQDVLARACTAQEKGDFLSYLNSVK